MLVLSRRLQYKGERIPTQDAVFANANANRAAILGNKLKLGFCGAGSVRDGSPEPQKKKSPTFVVLSCGSGDPYGNRTHVTAVKGPCLNRLTNGPRVVADVGFEPTTCRV